ncbi:MAG TPA: D-alanyl-D-alanine carboxypeptidase [Firmicutes bacterium]|nr:D-alanyl-D-alanine carboxypeptidase [Bacillota bacterium]
MAVHQRKRRPKRGGCFPVAAIAFFCAVGLAMGALGGAGEGESASSQEPLSVKPLSQAPAGEDGLQEPSSREGIPSFREDTLSSQEESAAQEEEPQPAVPEGEEAESQGTGQALSLSSEDLYSAAAYLVRRRDGAVLLDIHGTDPIWPASMTKMMTGYLGAALLDPEEEVTLPEEIFSTLYAENASLAGFLPGETVTVEELLYGTMVPSGAEAAAGIGIAVSGSEEAFVEEMNRAAQELGMDHTHFVNASGLHHPDHQSTAADLVLLLDTALDNSLFRQVFTTHEHLAYGSDHPSGLLLQSTLWSRIDWEGGEDWTLLGGKTGYTIPAGQCLASLAEKDGEEYILITAGAPGDGTTAPYHLLDAYTIFSAL